MFTSADELLQYLDDELVEMVDVRFCDLPGIMQHFTVPVSSFGQSVFDDGLGFDGSSIRGFQAIHESDMQLFPDPTTAWIDPFRKAKTLVVNFFIHDPLTGEAYSRDPRNIARKAIAYLKSTAIGDTAYFAPEAEFYIFDSVRFETKQNIGYYEIDSVAGAWNTGRDEDGGNKGYKVRYKGGYFPVAPTDHFGDNGSGMHCHQSIWNDGEPLFFDESGYAGLSDMARWYIGGLLKHAPSLLAFTNPTVNSYHRLVPGFEAPVSLVYSQRNRSACVRIPITGPNPKAKRIEFRCPDPSANPYLAFAALLLAGLDGIRNKIEPPQPIDKDIYELPPDELAEVDMVPTSLNAVLDSLEADHDFLLEGGVFTPDLIETWIEYKRTTEILPVQLRPHPHEFELYYDL